MSRPTDRPLDELSIKYLDHCALVQREAPNTTKARRRALRSLGRAGEATREDVETWWASRADLAPATRIAELALVRMFYKWCILYEHREDDPTIRIRAPRASKSVPKPARQADISRLLADETLDDQLKRAVVLGAFIGMRREEISKADWSDVDPDRGVVRIIGKGSKERQVSVGEAVLALLGKQLTRGNVVTAGGRAYHPEVLGRRLNRALESRDIRATCHNLRHYFGTAALAASNGNLRVVQELMGHASPNTTAGYTAPPADVARRIAEAIASELPVIPT